MLSFSHGCQLSRIPIIFSSALKAQLPGKVAKSFPKVLWIWARIKFVETRVILLPSNSGWTKGINLGSSGFKIEIQGWWCRSSEKQSGSSWEFSSKLIPTSPFLQDGKTGNWSEHWVWRSQSARERTAPCAQLTLPLDFAKLDQLPLSKSVLFSTPARSRSVSGWMVRYELGHKMLSQKFEW